MHITRTTGMLDMVLHPKFAENKWIYFTYHKPLDGDNYTLALARGRYDGAGFSDVKDLYVGNAVQDRRLAADVRTRRADLHHRWRRRPDQRTRRHQHDLRQDAAAEGRRDGARRQSVCRQGRQPAGDLHDRPSRPPRHRREPGDRPDLSRRSSDRSAATRSTSSSRAATTAGRPTDTAATTTARRCCRQREGIEPAWITWNPGITPSGLLFYTGDKFPEWKGNIFVGSIQRGRIPGTGALERVVFNDKLWELRRETILQDFHQRVRDVRQGPDGLIYLLTEEDDGAVIKIEPVN